MRFDIVYRVFIRDFRRQKKRITLTLLALAWGTISIMLLLGFGEGLHRQMKINDRGLGDGLAIVWGGQTSIPFKGMGKGRPIRLYPEDIPFLQERIPEIEMIGGQYDRWGVRVQFEDNIVSDHCTGVPPNFEEMRNFIPEMGGRMINDKDVEDRRRVAFLGFDLKKRVFGDVDPIGKQVLLNEMPFTVVGVMVEKLQTNSYSGQDEDLVVIPLTTFVAIFGDPYLDEMVYKIRDPRDNKYVEKRLYEVMGERYKFDPEDESALSIWDTIEGSREFENIMLGIKLFMTIIGGLTLLIAGVGVANIMYVSIKERTREIGIKMAVGARKAYILWQFLLEALLITFTGGALGMAISFVLTEAFKRVPIESEVLEFLGRPTLSFEIGIIVISILSVLGILAGFFPALRAASVSPVQSLRYE